MRQRPGRVYNPVRIEIQPAARFHATEVATMKTVSRRNQFGNGITDYIIVVVILAIAIGVAICMFRYKVGTKVQQSGDSAATTTAEPMK